MSPVLWGVDSGRAIWTQNFRQSLNFGRQRVASFCTFSYLEIIRRSCILMVLFHARSIWSVRIVVALEYFQEYLDTLAARQRFLHWSNHYVFFSLWSRPLKVLLHCIVWLFISGPTLYILFHSSQHFTESLMKSRSKVAIFKADPILGHVQFFPFIF